MPGPTVLNLRSVCWGFGGDTHFVLREIIIGVILWHWERCSNVLFPLKINFSFSSFSSGCSFPGFLASWQEKYMFSETQTWSSSPTFFLGGTF